MNVFSLLLCLRVDVVALAQVPLESLPSTWVPALKQVVRAALFYIGIAASASLFPIRGVLDAPAFLVLPLFQRLLYLWVAVTLFRFKYYFVWTLAEAGGIASGLAYNGRDAMGGCIWNRLNNVDAHKVELATNTSDMLNHWNKGTTFWLRNCTLAPAPCTSSCDFEWFDMNDFCACSFYLRVSC